MFKLRYLAIISLALSWLMPLATPVTAATLDSDALPQRFIVKFKTPSQATRDNVLRKFGASKVIQIPKFDATVVTVPGGLGSLTASQLAQDPAVEYAEPDYQVTADALPNDSSFGLQWGLENTGQKVSGQKGKVDADINASTAWNTTQGNGVKVAILDSGINASHPDLAAKIVATQNFSGTASAEDQYGHGTHVAGIVAAKTNNAVGVAGSCPGCLLMNIKVLDDKGNGYDSNIAQGVTWAVDNGAKVINMSFGGKGGDAKVLVDALNYAWSKGVVLVAAAGNNGNKVKQWPAAEPNVISVAATDNKDRKAAFSTFGPWVTMAAPGEDIYSTFPNHANRFGPQNYGYLSGTSMSAPMVSGTAGLVWASRYGTSVSAVKNRLQSSADQINGTGNQWQSGRLNAARAVQ